MAFFFFKKKTFSYKIFYIKNKNWYNVPVLFNKQLPRYAL